MDNSAVIDALSLANSLPCLLDSVNAGTGELTAACWSALVLEYNPIGFAENFLVRKLARLAASTLFDEQLHDAVEVQSQQAVSAFVPATSSEKLPAVATMLTRLCAADRLEPLKRRDDRNFAAFNRTLRELSQLQRERGNRLHHQPQPDPRFRTEQQCLIYLVRRFRTGAKPCRSCEAAGRGSWIATRRCWDCAACNTQTCLRDGTVFAHSQIGLVKWFHVIAIVLYQPRVSVRELANTVGIARLPTVRSMLRKVRAAMSSENATELLAGLDAVYLAGT